MNLKHPSIRQRTETSVALPGGLVCRVQCFRFEDDGWYDVKAWLPAHIDNTASGYASLYTVLVPQLQFEQRVMLLNVPLRAHWGTESHDSHWRWRRIGSSNWPKLSQRVVSELNALREAMAPREAARQSEGSHYFRVARLLGKL